MGADDDSERLYLMMLKELKNLSVSEWIKNLVLYFIGISIMPAGVVLTINAHIGAGGYDALNFALADKLHINPSIAIYGTSFIVLIVTALIRRSRVRPETFISSFFIGLFTDLWKNILIHVQGTQILTSVGMTLAGIVVICFAVACYIISIFPTNPTDDFVVALHERGLRLATAKLSLDTTCVILAYLLGGEIGVGTILCTFGVGPGVDLFHRLISKACMR